MPERTELQVHDFLIEGRDEDKSHVFLEIARPAPQEMQSHGHFFAIAELVGATPKTIQLVRAWIEFAIESYYSGSGTTTEAHFENILGQLNTQSSLYLKQHPGEIIHMCAAVVCSGSLYLAFHGTPAAILFYRTDDSWRAIDLAAQNAEEFPGLLFSNIVNGTLRPEDRLLLATPHVTEFFNIDRLCKISENKSLAEVAEHMEHVFTDLSSDYSFGTAWLRIQHIIEEESLVPKQQEQELAPPTQHKKSSLSMMDLAQKTKSTASLLAPPVITIPKDKIVTNILQLAQRGLISAGHHSMRAARSTFSFLNAHARKINVAKIIPRIPLSKLSPLGNSASISNFGLATGPHKKYTKLGVGILFLIVLISIGSVISYKHAEKQRALIASELDELAQKITAADQAFTYQNEAGARQLISEADMLFKNIPSSASTESATIAGAKKLAETRAKVLHIVVPQIEVLAEKLPATDIVFSAQESLVLGTQGEISVIHLGATTGAATITAAQKLYRDDDDKRIIVLSASRALKSIATNSVHTATPITVDWLPENTRFDAGAFYAGRLYVYDMATRMIYRYDKSGPSSYSSGKKWITDSGKPTDITQLSADTSLWLRSAAGGVLKFTAGKLQPFAFGAMVPEFTHADQVIATQGASTLYFLDREHARVVVTDREGKLARQYSLPAGTNFKKFDIDKNETAVTGITDDGRVVRFALTK